MTDEPVVTDEVEDFDGAIRQYDANTDTLVGVVAPPVAMKRQLIMAMQTGLTEPIHLSNTGVGPGSGAWATLIIEGPYYVDIRVRSAFLGAPPRPALSAADMAEIVRENYV